MLLLILSVLVFNLIAFFVPKRISKIEMYTAIFFSLYMQTQTDIFLDLKLNLYDYFEPGVDTKTMIAILGLYPALAVLIVNYFPFHQSFLRKTVYTIGWSVFCTLFEWASDKSVFFYHNGWKYGNSFLVYNLVVILLALNAKLIRKWELQSTKRDP